MQQFFAGQGQLLERLGAAEPVQRLPDAPLEPGGAQLRRNESARVPDLQRISLLLDVSSLSVCYRNVVTVILTSGIFVGTLPLVHVYRNTCMLFRNPQ